ncbi:MAG: hypothetical protein HUU55_14020 [Myxococcales bacterium]|nr:hypothetical protein [Myxococcales bacterium]
MKTVFKFFANFGNIPSLLVCWVVLAPAAIAQPSPKAGVALPESAAEDPLKRGADGETKKVESKKTGTETSSQTKRGGRASKIEQLEALVIEGKVQKPEVFYVLGRADARFMRQQIRKSFTEKIITSVADNPF